MSTRAALVRKSPEGYEAIYVHSDGYPSYMLTTLNTHYTHEALVDKLFQQGNASFIDETPELSIFYHRDRNETYIENKPTKFERFDVLTIKGDMDVQFVYLYNGIRWHLAR